MSGQPQTTVRSVDELLVTLNASPEAKAKIDQLREKLYGHVLRLVDLDVLYAIEQMLWSLVGRTGVDDEESVLTNALLAEALANVPYDPERNGCTTPHGITDEEILAVEYDETCELCQHDLGEVARRRAGSTDRFEDWADPELQSMHAAAATRWRQDHADALQRFDALTTRRAARIASMPKAQST